MRNIFILFVLFVCIANAQNTSVLDSLTLANLDYKKEDTTKVNLLNKLAFECQKINPTKGIEFAQKSIEIATKINDVRGKDAALNIIEVNEFAMRQYSIMKGEYEKIIQEKKQANSSVSGQVSNVGKVYISLSDYPKAVDYLNQAQTFYGSVKNNIGIAKSYNAIGTVYLNLSDLSFALENFQKALVLNEAENEKAALANTYNNMGSVFLSLEQSAKALEYYNKSLAINQQLGGKQRLALNYYLIGNAFMQTRENVKALEQFQKILEIASIDDALKAKALSAIGNVYSNLKDNVKALNYLQQALLINKGLEKENSEKVQVVTNQAQSPTSQAQELQQKAEFIIDVLDVKSALANNYLSIGKLYLVINDFEKSLTFLRLGKLLSKQLHTLKIESLALKTLSNLFDAKGNHDSAYVYYRNFILLRDSISSSEKQKEITRKDLQFAFDKKESEYKLQQQITDEKLKQQLLEAKQKEALLKLRSSELDRSNKQKELERLQYLKAQAELSAQKSENSKKAVLLQNAAKEKLSLSKQQKQQEELAEQKIREQKTIRNSLMGGAFMLLILLVVLVNRYRLKQKSETELNKAYEELKLTQQQLVQQEKLASLGELTAGIAHEIKNPLNFVNNFAEISSELIDELNETNDPQERQELLTDIKNNLQKINHHGKRADSIVQNMLQHSRGNAGEKQPTDISKLCDEYADLAFHGMRATVQGFQCSISKNFSPNLAKLNIIQQDVSRVILNILNNAFYAVNKKSLMMKDASANIDATWKPTVGITTQTCLFDGKQGVEIKIRDNGTGMPESVKQKIFEPFYTTKPTGEGTGLGLSLSYDIITKAHNGKIDVISADGEFTEFSIYLPLSI